MTLNLKNKKYNNYLNTYDILCKYKLVSIKNQPKLNKIVIEFPLTQNFKRILKSDEITNNLKIKSVFLLYNLFGLFPFIAITKTKTLQKSKKIIKTNITLKYILTQQNLINNFLISIFTELEKPFQYNKLKFFQKKNKYFSSNFFVYTTKIYCYLFHEVEFLLQNFFSFVLYKNMKFKINFIFSNVKTNFFSANIIKNLFLFWKIC